MFIDNKYTKTYFKIIDKYKNSVSISGYSEKHHIIPKSMGGTNDDYNIVVLSAKAHFICHHLLTKMVINRQDQIKMIHAFWRMCHTKTQKQKIHPIIYQKLKIERSKAIKESKNWWIGKKHTEESRIKMSNSAKGRNPHKHKNYKKPNIWNSGLNKDNDQRLSKLSTDRAGSKNVMYGKTGKLHPHSKEFTLFDDKRNPIMNFHTILELKKWCKINKIPFNGIQKTLKTNIPFKDGSKNKRFCMFNGWIAIYN